MMRLCQCGCQQPVTKTGNFFIKGHCNRGKTASTETKLKMSNSLKGHPGWRKGEHGFFSIEARQKISANRRNQPSPTKGKHHSNESKLKISLANKGRKPWNTGKQWSEEKKQALSISNKGNIPWNKGIFGEQSPRWEGGKSFEPYTVEFNKQLKELIRLRDNYTCQLCGVPQAECIYLLAVHHIDYDKTNCLPSNLISLCASCHSQTNTSHDKWQNLLESVIRQKVTI